MNCNANANFSVPNKPSLFMQNCNTVIETNDQVDGKESFVTKLESKMHKIDATWQKLNLIHAIKIQIFFKI